MNSCNCRIGSLVDHPSLYNNHLYDTQPLDSFYKPYTIASATERYLSRYRYKLKSNKQIAFSSQVYYPTDRRSFDQETFVRRVYCRDGCCKILLGRCSKKEMRMKKSRYKAGVFIYDPDSNKLLLVQSRNNLWGIPKGTLKFQETHKECALRELYEETGLELKMEDIDRYIKVASNIQYYYIEMKECDVKLQLNEYNDANAIGWIKLSCIKNLMDCGLMRMTHHSKYAIQHILGVQL